MTTAMEQQFEPPDDFWLLVQRMCDGTASVTDRDRLERRLITHVELRGQLLEYLRTHAELQWIYRGADSPLTDVIGTSTPPHFELTRAKPASRAAINFRFLAKPGGWMPGGELLVGTLLLVGIAAAFWGLATFSLRVWRSAREDNFDLVAASASHAESYVAELVSSDGCRWATTDPTIRPAPQLHSRFFKGQVLELISGVTKIQFVDGAVVTLEGPVRFELQDQMQGFLQHGKLVAMVPRQAIGFMVQTATATVVDLGTEFAVEADKQGATEVHVFQGRVELCPESRSRQLNSPITTVPPITLTAGDARRVEPEGQSGDVVVREIAATPARFKRSPTTAPAEMRHIQVEGAYASSSHPEPRLDVGNLIRGRGLNGDRHVAHWQDTMWHSDYGDIKNVFVQFDLMRLHRLKSMKVWNFNDSRFAFAGVKQADIYVSTSGKGDPLSKPAEWKLVVENQQFAPGTGKDDYDTPTVVPLSDSEGRFVAIVIDERLGPDPQEKPDPDLVGLSEVQFFGSRVELQKSLPKQPEK